MVLSRLLSSVSDKLWKTQLLCNISPRLRMEDFSSGYVFKISVLIHFRNRYHVNKVVYHIQTSKVFMVKSSLYSSSSKDQMSIAIRWRPRHFPPKIPNKTKNKLFFKANGSVFINVCEDLSIKCFK